MSGQQGSLEPASRHRTARTKTLIRLEWLRHRREFLNALGLSLFTVLALPGDNALGLLVVGSLASLYVGVHALGEDASQNRLEFLLSRGMSRSWLFYWRYLFGLTIILAIALFTYLCDLWGTHNRLWSAISEIPLAVDRVPLLHDSVIIGLLVMIYTIAFGLGAAVTTRRHLVGRKFFALAIAASLFVFVTKCVEAMTGNPFRDPWDIVHVNQGLVACGYWLLSLLFFLSARSRFLLRPL